MPAAALNALVFDCDGTLSEIEGIVTLARWNGVEAPVAELTELAMSQTGITPGLYAQRLALTRPSLAQCEALGEAYFETRTPGIDTVLAYCRAQTIPVWVISAGVNPSVRAFTRRLGVPDEQVFAVDLQFDAQGQYQDFDHHSPLTRLGGKREVVKHIQQRHPQILYVGDGQNDLEVAPDVSCFVGYGGAYYRPHIEAQCAHYLKEPDFTPLIDYLALQQGDSR